MTSLSYDLPDTATREHLREALDLRMKTLRAYLLLHADKMIELSVRLIEPRDVQEVAEAARDIATELDRVILISDEMRGILAEKEGL